MVAAKAENVNGEFLSWSKEVPTNKIKTLRQRLKKSNTQETTTVQTNGRAYSTEYPSVYCLHYLLIHFLRSLIWLLNWKSEGFTAKGTRALLSPAPLLSEQWIWREGQKRRIQWSNRALKANSKTAGACTLVIETVYHQLQQSNMLNVCALLVSNNCVLFALRVVSLSWKSLMTLISDKFMVL